MKTTLCQINLRNRGLRYSEYIITLTKLVKAQLAEVNM